uniref:Sushi, von Willebrand factor type A, EGF and pentraxin domain-containing protein 1 n=1 Tax=Heligmosomoides polygyrus TaxID=6339 RepID=A0A8L8KFJ7_HELPZ
LCASAPCVHGLCVDTLFTRRCICEEGWTGENCDANIDDCAAQPCQNGGTCTDEVAGFSCACPAGYRGVHCQHLVDHCSTSPCRNNAACASRAIVASTARPESIRCEQETGSCDAKPCRNDGRCVNLVADYFCVCPEGVSGKNCEIAPNRCLGEPCLNGGVCGDFGSRQECICPKKFTGPGKSLPLLNLIVIALMEFCSGCQYLQDACTESVCQNDGQCNRTSDGGFKCVCKPGFTGAHCETNIDDCARSPCPLGATCIDQINVAYCRCPFNMTGANCDKVIDEDYDLHFFDALRPASASLALPFRISTKTLTLSLWVKFDQAQSKGRVLTMYNSREANYSADVKEVLRLDSEGMRIALFANESNLQLHFPANQRINDGAWNHLVFTWSSDQGSYSLIWNSVRIFGGTGYGSGSQVNMNALITLGNNDREEVSFAGSLTRVHVWSRVLDFDSEIPMMVVSCHGTEVSLHPKRFSPATVFTWGEYDVVYVAHDNASNTAECNFKTNHIISIFASNILTYFFLKIHVSREHCPPLEDPVNGVQACESWGPQLRYKACSIECRDGYEFSRSPAVFYTCAADGMWRPRYHNQLVFRYPQCTK